jgi:hypothetical protein
VGGARILNSLGCSDTSEREDRDTADQWDDLRRLLVHSAGCTGARKRREGNEDENIATNARSGREVRPGANQSGGPDQSSEELSWHACLRRQGQAEVSP